MRLCAFALGPPLDAGSFVGWVLAGSSPSCSSLRSAWLLAAVLRGRDATWARIQETGVWRVGMDPSFPPFENLDAADAAPAGFDVDLADAIAARGACAPRSSALGSMS